MDPAKSHVYQVSVVCYSNQFIIYTCICTDQGSCTGGFRLADEGSGYLPNGRSIYVGRAEVCLNGTYTPLCNSIVDDNLAQLFCYQQYGSEYSK